MARIEFQQRPGYLAYEHPPECFGAEIVIRIDGQPLWDLVAAAQPGEHGEYIGLAVSELPSGYFLAQTDGFCWATFADDQPGRTLLLRCTCGELGCWPLSAIIDVEPDRIIWRDFRHGHRERWRYKKLGDGGRFIFDRQQYEEALVSAGLASPQHLNRT